MKLLILTLACCSLSNEPTFAFTFRLLNNNNVSVRRRRCASPFTFQDRTDKLFALRTDEETVGITKNLGKEDIYVVSIQNGATSEVAEIDSFPKISSSSNGGVTLSATKTSNNADINFDESRNNYRNGLITIGAITLLFASNSPALHSAFSMTNGVPPVLLINAAVSAVGLLGVILASPTLGRVIPDPSTRPENKELSEAQFAKSMDNAVNSDAHFTSPPSNLVSRVMGPSVTAGAELGLWKFLGTTANIYGLSQTSSDHGAFLIQLTTLLVPAAQGLMGVPIPTRIWTAIGLALSGVFIFTQDPNQSDSATLAGDSLCALAAIFYATYDLRLFKWGKIVATNQLITTKMVTQSILSLVLLFTLGLGETRSFLSEASPRDLELVAGVSLWSGIAVNALAPYLQVSGQQAVGPARAQILYASQPLWAAIISFLLLGEQVGIEGFTGGTAFLGAMFLAATAETPDPNCPAEECEV